MTDEPPRRADRPGEEDRPLTRQELLERAATDPIELIENLVHDAPATAPEIPAYVAAPRRRRPLAGVALTLSLVGLVVSWFMPWGMPVSVLGAVLAIVALRRTWERRAVSWWALGLGILGAACSSYWIGWIVDQLSARSAG